MEKRNWIFSEADKTVVAPFWEKIPDKIIDVHSHIYRLKDLGRQFTPYTDGPEIVGIQEWQQQMQYFLGDGKLLSAYHTAPPCETKAHIEASNHFVMQELESHPESKGFVLIAPDTGRDYRTKTIFVLCRLCGAKIRSASGLVSSRMGVGMCA